MDESLSQPAEIRARERAIAHICSHDTHTHTHTHTPLAYDLILRYLPPTLKPPPYNYAP